ncbi:unnamed protein product [Rotaria sordida]|uniref:Uncharacterized protein n=1 Tax=Rotaria sordida TaxID=392033 RepID=A0A815K1J9_9BILA|nr:unnamed protein product [Rotaria sordida]
MLTLVKYLITNEYTHSILDIYHRYLPLNANNSENNPSTSLYEFIIYILSSIDMHSGMIENDEELIMSLVPSHFRLVIIMITTND